MLTRTCRIVCGQRESEGTQEITPFEIKYSQTIAASTPDGIYWQPADLERFQLVANETVKIGQPVNRADADHWIEQVRARALEPGEMVGRVKVN